MSATLEAKVRDEVESIEALKTRRATWTCKGVFFARRDLPVHELAKSR